MSWRSIPHLKESKHEYCLFAAGKEIYFLFCLYLTDTFFTERYSIECLSVVTNKLKTTCRYLKDFLLYKFAYYVVFLKFISENNIVLSSYLMWAYLWCTDTNACIVELVSWLGQTVGTCSCTKLVSTSAFMYHLIYLESCVKLTELQGIPNVFILVFFFRIVIVELNSRCRCTPALQYLNPSVLCGPELFYAHWPV